MKTHTAVHGDLSFEIQADGVVSRYTGILRYKMFEAASRRRISVFYVLSFALFVK